MDIEHPAIGSQDLRSRAIDRLRKELASSRTLEDAGQHLYELRINQIEIELLSEEFGRLRREISGNRRHRQTDEGCGYGYFFLSREGQICEMEFGSTGACGANLQQGSGLFINDCLVPGERAKFRSFLRHLFEQDGKMSCELSFRQARYPGLKLPLYAMVEGVADEEKKHCLIVVEDVSAKRLSEQRQRAGNTVLSMLNKIVASSHNEIFMFDANSMKFTFANHRALENLGYTMDELKLLTPADIQTADTKQQMAELSAYLSVQKKTVGKLEAVHARRDGSLYPVEIYLQFFEYEAGSSFIAIVLDVSSRKAVESQLKSIVESAHAIIWASNVELELLFMSDHVQDILGYPASELIGTSLTALLDRVHESDRARLNDGYERARLGQKVTDLRYRARHADGSWRWLSLNMTPNLSIDGKIAQLVGVAHDIHTQKLAEEELQRLNQQLDFRVQEEILKNRLKDTLLQRQSRLAGMGEMIGNIAHQWRQPINSLGLILSDLEDAALYGECDLAYMQTAVEKSKIIIQKMSRTIDDFRHFFRADKSVKVFSLRQVTDECLNIVEAAMKSNNIDVCVRCERDVEVSGFENEYSQVVMNILSNAKDAIVGRAVDGGEIVIEITDEEGYGVLSLTDNGGGISQDVLPKIFEPHFTTKEHGVGIGLYMSLVSIEKNMNGRIVAQNVGRGARFSIYLPCAATGDDHAERR